MKERLKVYVPTNEYESIGDCKVRKFTVFSMETGKFTEKQIIEETRIQANVPDSVPVFIVFESNRPALVSVPKGGDAA